MPVLTVAGDAPAPPGGEWTGQAAPEIVKAAQLGHADLLIIGLREPGRWPVELPHIGSTAGQVMRQASCAVVTVPDLPIPGRTAVTHMAAGAPEAASWRRRRPCVRAAPGARCLRPRPLATAQDGHFPAFWPMAPRAPRLHSRSGRRRHMVKRMAIDNILCPTDCTEASLPAMRRALSLAGRFGARVTALHVTPLLPPPETGGTWARYLNTTADELAAWRRKDAGSLDTFIAPFLDRGVSIETQVLSGVSDAPWREICAAAAALAADIIVMGTHQRTGLDHLLAGSVAEKVLRVAPCPVLIVSGPDGHDAATPMFHRIVCATDLGEGARTTVDTALSLAQESLARLVLLHVVEDVREPDSVDFYRPVPDAAAFRQALGERAQQQLGRLGAAASSFCDFSIRVEAGKAWEEVVHVAEEERADLIVLGAHAHGGLGRLLLGSPANQIVRHAPCAVLIARDDVGMTGALSIAQPARAAARAS